MHPFPARRCLRKARRANLSNVFLDFCRQEYPARHYILVILGHGEIIGNDTFLQDDFVDTEHYMSLNQLGAILKDFSVRPAQENSRWLASIVVP